MRSWSARPSASDRRALARIVVAAVALAGVGRAVADDTYLSEADAPAAVFPTADRFERSEVKSTPDLRARVAQRLGDVKPSVWEASYKIATAFAGARRLGRAIEVEEIGKHRPITLVVGMDDEDKVAGVAVMTYREAYGGEIRSRRFLQQYQGKRATDRLAPSQDIQNITGATLSARAVGRAVKKAIAVLHEAGDGAPAAAAPRTMVMRAGGCASGLSCGCRMLMAWTPVCPHIARRFRTTRWTSGGRITRNRSPKSRLKVLSRRAGKRNIPRRHFSTCRRLRRYSPARGMIGGSFAAMIALCRKQVFRVTARPSFAICINPRRGTAPDLFRR